MKDLLTIIWINSKNFDEYIKHTKKQGFNILDTKYQRELFERGHKND